ncbi:DUF262 domain-containing protein [Paenibacillus sp. 2KB_22]|uniref:DUF262 domain-containing protein n=1 Tax=Paenibacillus sp. 2KB_22 TaxID=3232978 RepID=UPI003F9773B2
MKAEARSLTFLANEGEVKIPFFQRAYVWDKTNWEELISELLQSSKSHFLGSLILKQIEIQSGSTKQVLVIDGQQRLTTLSILLRALFDSFDTLLQEKCQQDGKFDACLFYKKDMFDDDLLVKIEHSKVDKKYYQQVIRGEIVADAIDLHTCNSNILKCYKFFVDRLVNVSLKDRQTLFNDLLSSTNSILVVIDLTEDDDEQAIFDTINSAGMRLSSADIVKNVLFQRAFELIGNQEYVEALYQDSWESVFANDEQSITFWDTARSTGRMMRDNIELLLHSIAVIEGFFDPEKHSLSDLSNIYKEHIRRLDKNELTKFIRTISEFAKLYREKIIVFENSDLFGFTDYNKRLFHVLSVCDVSTFHPYILFLYRKYEGNETKLAISLKKLETLVIRRTVCKLETKNYNKICKDLISDSSKIDILLAEVTDNDVSNGLMSISNKHAALLLFWVELFRRKNDNRYDRDELKYTYTLEHLLPQKWEEHWRNVPIIDEDGQSITDWEEAKKYRYKLIYSIGNMTLLKSSLNSSLRNYEFQRKVEGEGRKRGIKHYAELGITKLDIVTHYETGDRSWDEIKIRKRTEKITEDVLKIWSNI